MATNNPDTLKGTLLYQPRGAAGEYAKWALNLYNGCTHGCTYCYNRRGMLSYAFGDKPQLAAPIVKKAEADMTKNKQELLNKARVEFPVIPEADLKQVLSSIDFYTEQALKNILDKDIDKIGANRIRQDGGIFMSFKCDPFDKDTRDLTFVALFYLLFSKRISVTLLTKSVDFISDYEFISFFTALEMLEKKNKDVGHLTIGVTITGMDEMEPNAPSTADRIALLKTIREQYPHIRTFVSLEPVIDITKAMNDVLHNIYGHTDEIRIGCQSPLKRDRYDPKAFLSLILMLYKLSPSSSDEHIVTRITLKHSVRAQVEFFPLDIRYKCLALIHKIEDNQR